MHDLIESVHTLVAETAERDDNVAESASLLLERIDWKHPLEIPASVMHPVVEQRLEEACDNAGPPEGHAFAVCDALRRHYTSLTWALPWGEYLEHADMAALVQNFAFTTVVGPGCLLPAEDLFIGFSIQGPDLHYPMHAHLAGETYWIIGGDGDWKIGVDAWFPVETGQTCLHVPGMRHAIQTNRKPLLNMWAWWSDIDSNIVMIRG